MTETNADRIAMRVQILVQEIKPPRTGTVDEIAATLHELALGIVGLGGCRVLDNARAILAACIDTWPAHTRPSEADVSKAAAWVIRQDPMMGMDRDPGAPTAACLRDRLEAAISGQLVAVPTPWPTLACQTQALLPGAITLLVGSPGASKSFMVLQAVIWWLHEGWKAALYALEEDLAYWLNRALALTAGVGAITDPAWIATNPERARALFAEHKDQLDDLAAAITCAPPQGIDLRGLAEWIAQQAKAGCRVICADPITAASTGAAKPWLAAEDFMLRAKRAAVEHGASLVLTSHGRKGDTRAKGPPDLDSLAGGAAYARFASTVLWLEAQDGETMPITDADGRDRFAGVNRRLRILKARNGRGTGQTIGCWFDGGTLRCEEAGLLNNTKHTGSHLRAQPADASHQAERLRAKPSEREDLFNQGDA